MKRYYTSALSMALCGAMMAQGPVQSTTPFAKNRIETISQAVPANLPSSIDREVVWSDDFSVPSNWDIGNINDPSNNNWVIGTGAPSGDFAIPAIASTTAANGFGLFDSDLLCGGTQNAFIQNAEPIDLSGHSDVVLQFEQYYRKFQGATYVDVSSDGISWATTEVNAGMAVNAATPNPLPTEVNISSVGNQGTVWIRFRYVGGCDYAWMVDDVAVVTQVPVERSVVATMVTHLGDSLQYGRIPSNQFLGELIVGGGVYNAGAVPQTNLTLTAVVANAQSEVVASHTANFGTVVSDQTVTFEEALALPGVLAQGLYTVTYTVSSDQDAEEGNPDDDTYVRYFQVNDGLYGIDQIDVRPDTELNLTSTGTNSYAGNTDGVILATYFYIAEETEINGLQALITANSVAGASAIFSLHYSDDIVGTGAENAVAESDVIMLEQSHVNSGVFSGDFLGAPVILLPGDYYACVTLYSNSGANHVAVLDDGTIVQNSGSGFVYLANGGSGANWYNGGRAYALRLAMNADPLSTTEITGLEGVSVYPNPTEGTVWIDVKDATGAQIVEVRDLVGGLVYQGRFNGRTSIDLSGQANGLYLVKVGNAAAGFATYKVTLQ